MKARYRLDELIEFGNEEHGRVTGVIKRKDGFYYEVNSSEAEVAEAQVTAAYKPKTQKVVKEKKAAKTRKAAKVTDQDSVTQQ